MAYIGLRKPFVGKRTAEGTYSDPFAFGKAVSVTDTPNVASAELYGDDVLAESEKGVTSTAIELGITDIPDDAYVDMFGHTKGTDSSEITYAIDDAANYCGLGLIGVKKVDGVRKFEARWYPKVLFDEPTTSINTKADSTEFQTPSTTGTGMANDSGVWRQTETFSTEAEALAYINKKFGKTTT